MTEMTQEIRDRLTTLETKHEERHNQVQGTLGRIASAVESIADNQNRMSHMGAKLEKLETIVAKDHDRLGKLETKQGIIWSAIVIVVTAIVGTIVQVWP